jgi:carbon monoxide dehydrogenase subunit G
MSNPKVLSKSHFVIDAPQDRVWRLMASAVFQCLPLEQIEVADQSHFGAKLTLQFGFLKIPVNLSGHLEMVPQSKFANTIEIQKWIFKLGTKVIFSLKPTGDEKTEIDCLATDDGKGTIMGLVTRGKQRSFAQDVFKAFQKRLVQMC